LAFPWLEVRRNEAYPVFTHASSDQRSPWWNTPADFDDSGQINAYFRWKDLSDMQSSITMQLWIAHPSVQTPPAAMPDTATADITIRRMQQFKVRQGLNYAWQLSRDGHIIASGHCTPDVADLLTIPHVTLTISPVELSLKSGT
jgi:hypothetical protein